MTTELPHSMLNFLYEDRRSIALPSTFPQSVTLPKYPIGARCRWIPMQNTDWGRVIGHAYMPKNPNIHDATPQWSWIYLLLLDADSPSWNWIVTDWVGEEDLELLPEYPLSIAETNSEVP